MSNKELAEEVHKPIIKRIKKRKVYWSYIGNIYDGDLTAMQLISKFSQGIHFLLCVTDIFSNTHELFLWKIKKSYCNYWRFPSIIEESNRKPNKIWIDKVSEFYNRLMKSWLQYSNIEIQLTYNEG